MYLWFLLAYLPYFFNPTLNIKMVFGEKIPKMGTFLLIFVTTVKPHYIAPPPPINCQTCMPPSHPNVPIFTMQIPSLKLQPRLTPSATHFKGQRDIFMHKFPQNPRHMASVGID